MKDNQAKYPQLRFKGFTDPWEQRKAKDLFIPVNERNREDLPVLSVTQDQGVVFRNDLAIDIKYDESTLSSYKVIHPGDFVISLRSFQGGFELSNVLGISSPAYTIFNFAVPSEQDKLYWKTIFKTFKFIESLKTVTFGIRDGKSISFKEFGDLKINYPSDVDEQLLIGEFFAKLDETIAANQRKLDLLKEQKKGYLQKMFPKNGAKVPELRFAGFADAWVQRKIGNYFTERSERSSNGELISVTINSGVVKASTLDRKDNSSKNKYNYKKVEIGDIAYNSMRMWQGASGYSPYSGILSPAYTVITSKDDVDSKFFAYQFKKHDMIQIFQRNSQGLTSDTWNLKFPSLKSIKVTAPAFDEQKRIATFLEEFDHLITLHQRKLAKLKELKKGYLQKLFPQNSEKVPEFRFKGYSDAWEKRKLGELANIRRGASPRPIKNKKWFSQTSQVGWIRISDVTEQNGRIHQVEQHLSDAGQKKTLVLKSKHLLLSIAATVGKPVQNYIQVGVHDGFIVFMDPKFDLDFMFYFLEKYRPNWARFGQPGSQININSELVRDLVVSIPTAHEQVAVAQFIITLDNLIAATQCKLDLLKKLKKGYLQKMFC